MLSYLQDERAYPILIACNDANEVIVSILRIDHVHIYVNDIAEAEVWYKDVLGFIRDESLLFWFTQGGPLVLKNNEAALSLFEKKDRSPGHTVAFSIKPSYFSELMKLLSLRLIPFTVSDHQISMSVYFEDVDGNKIEMTSYEYLEAKENIQSYSATLCLLTVKMKKELSSAYP
ncbi:MULTISPECIES: VOC family protein [unclassified Enterobacter]|uniref:VOC family protein n=1 Tax=unclassified Enterobacter TaxID=2608935 RepID=UPI0017D78446|nr:catechol 2,3-dioxygenase-like lactoylglutathione lyase family enzyme [Enterobacter sp. Sphag1F]NYI16688.1 catechol 2,3-dioxygenase-like lactoylglutathione lyase family enzyme [Enterobacter sp. Sphag71]